MCLEREEYKSYRYKVYMYIKKNWMETNEEGKPYTWHACIWMQCQCIESIAIVHIIIVCTRSETTAKAHATVSRTKWTRASKQAIASSTHTQERNRQGMRISFIVIYSTYTLYLMVLLIFLQADG